MANFFAWEKNEVRAACGWFPASAKSCSCAGLFPNLKGVSRKKTNVSIAISGISPATAWNIQPISSAGRYEVCPQAAKWAVQVKFEAHKT
jgi:hypothetical protein